MTSSPTPARATTTKGRARREQIIESATELFYERGFRATGIDDIGEAAGITGPGIYRHFASKDDILIAVLDRLWRRLEATIGAANLLDASRGLELLVSVHIDLVVDRRTDVALLLDELPNLPEEYRSKARANAETYRSAWASRIRLLHEEFSKSEADAVARSLMGLVTAHDADRSGMMINPDRAKDLLGTMVRGALAGVV
jgi:AcrR family transcriptional regulator